MAGDSGGFTFDDESTRLHHQPCGKSVLVEARLRRVVERYKTVHRCDGPLWAGHRPQYVDPGRTGIGGDR